MENKVVNEEFARLGLEEENMQSDGAKWKDIESMPSSYSLWHTDIEAHLCPCVHARSAMSGPEMKRQFEIVNQMSAVAHCNISGGGEGGEEGEEEEGEGEGEGEEEGEGEGEGAGEDEEDKAIFKLQTIKKVTGYSLLELFMWTRKRAARLAKKNDKEAWLSQNNDMLPV